MAGRIKWRGPTATTNVFLLGILFWLAVFVVSCYDVIRVTDTRGSRWFYSCDVPDYWVSRVLAVYGIQVLPWAEFNKAAWEHKLNPKNTRSFMQGTSIWLREGYSLDNLYHEIAHTWDNWTGEYGGHNPECWQHSKPVGYDDKLVGLFQRIDVALPE